PETLARADYGALVIQSFEVLFPHVSARTDKRALRKLMSSGAAFELRRLVLETPSLIGKTKTIWLPAADDIDMYAKGQSTGTERVTARQASWLNELRGRGLVERHFNSGFFSSGDSREPELAGILGAVVGSFLTLTICLGLAFPLGVMTAVYLEEFAPKNRWTDLIEVNINNLAAVPSIVFGLLGVAVLLGIFGMPRSAPIVGGIVLALMTLPTVIITGRAALQAVPPSIREAALAIGASSMQVVWHHVLPLAMPGVATGTIIGMARALGETAPLLMIGMVAFVVDIPTGPTDPATTLTVQIFLWADAPERAFAERTAAAIVVLLGFLVIMNLAAVILRRRFERRW
ncbi:MAG: phosphate ABC transporter permease PstA, partial [Proteobacteria bacterium]|nr:phosphate ABC transporter permease PstA [Pseudomonadota bacterium]